MSNDKLKHDYDVLAKERTRLNRLYAAAKKKHDVYKAQLAEHDEYMRQCLLEDKLESIRVRGMNYTQAARDIAQITDFDAFFAYVRRTKAIDLLHRRVSLEALRERLKAHVKVPGVELGVTPYLSVSKAKLTKGGAQ